MHAAGGEGLGSMKSQFRKADASGARYALIFGADERLRGEAALKSLRDPAAPQRSVALGRCRRVGCDPHRIIPRLPAPARLARALPASAMATHLDLEEQEQLDQLKAFWKQYGNLVTWVLVLVLGGYAAWNGWMLYQRDQGAKAGALYDEIERAAQAGDSQSATRIFDDMKSRYPRATFTDQAGLARRARRRREGPVRRGDSEPRLGRRPRQRRCVSARSPGCAWPACCSTAKKYEEALKQLDAHRRRPSSPRLRPTAAATSCCAQGKNAEAQAAYLKAWTAMDPKLDYRRLIEAKLNLLGVQPAAGCSERAEAAK